eukprot:6466612-Amphidinium_carterae.1
MGKWVYEREVIPVRHVIVLFVRVLFEWIGAMQCWFRFDLQILVLLEVRSKALSLARMPRTSGYQGSQAALKAVLMVHVKDLNYCRWGKSRSTKQELCVHHKLLIRELRTLHPSGNFVPAMMSEALFHVATDGKFMKGAKKNEVQAWAKTMGQRIRLMMGWLENCYKRRGGGTSEAKLPTWMKICLGIDDEAEDDDDEEDEDHEEGEEESEEEKKLKVRKETK